MGNVVVFVDESGIIPKHKSKKTNYFIITLLFLREEDQGLVKKLSKSIDCRLRNENRNCTMNWLIIKRLKALQ